MKEFACLMTRATCLPSLPEIQERLNDNLACPEVYAEICAETPEEALEAFVLSEGRLLIEDGKVLTDINVLICEMDLWEDDWQSTDWQLYRILTKVDVAKLDLKTDDKTEETREAGLREAISATLRQAIKSSDKPESSNG